MTGYDYRKHSNAWMPSRSVGYAVRLGYCRGDLADVVRETVEALESLDEIKTLDLEDGDDYSMIVDELESMGDMDERDIMGLVKAALKGASESITGNIEGLNDIMRDIDVPLRVLHLDEIKAIGNHLDRVDHEDDLNNIIKEVLT